jgi:hypothetical protein
MVVKKILLSASASGNDPVGWGKCFSAEACAIMESRVPALRIAGSP